MFHACLGSKIFKHVLIFSKPGMSRASVLYVLNKVHARYMRVEDALNAFDTRSRNDSVRYMRVPILREIASVTYPKRV